MKKYSILLIIVAAFSSCNKNDIITNDGGISIEMGKSYIQFDTEIQTRGIITGEILEDDFAVLGYQYRSSWEYEQIVASPNVFEDTPQIVEWKQDEDGNFFYTYTPEQVWTGNKYSFFAYYPCENQAIKLFDNGSTKSGEPYITYTLPDTNDPRKLLDVMTASVNNTDVEVSNLVALQMFHRLTAIGVSARNLVTDKVTGKGLSVQITDLTVNFKDIKVTGKIFLDNDSKKADEYTGAGNRQFKFIGNSEWTYPSLSVNYNESKTILEKINNETKELSVLLMPQTDYLNGTIQLSYKIADGSPVSKTFDFTFNKKLSKGRRYEVELLFTSDAISINVDNEVDWDSHDIYHDFE